MAKNVEKVTPSIEELVQSMFETMYLESGIGLAAPQVGEGLRVIVVDVAIVDPKDPEKYTSDPVALINPVITKGTGKIEYEEGCLSCPDLIVTVDRLNEIEVAYLDPKGKACTLTANNLKAVCIQHEIDHLNGILLVDKIARVEQDLYKKKRIRIAKDDKDFAGVL